LGIDENIASRVGVAGSTRRTSNLAAAIGVT